MTLCTAEAVPRRDKCRANENALRAELTHSNPNQGGDSIRALFLTRAGLEDF